MTEVNVEGKSGAGWSKVTRRWAARVVALLVLGVALVALALWFRGSRRPTPAPEHVQLAGIEEVHKVLEIVRLSPFGGSERGQTLLATIDRMLARRHIIFTNEVDHSGWTLRGKSGDVRIYLKVLVGDSGVFHHQDTTAIADALFHEAVHATQRGVVCIEEEWDAFDAGLSAAAAVRGVPLRLPLQYADRAVADYVAEAYSHLPGKADYRPVGMTLDRLRERVIGGRGR